MTMFEIDRKRFGAFVAELRKGKGFTQKELAGRLFLSDKAVSKWETGASLPDTALLIPLADLLGVSVTELLMCERMARSDTLEANKVEDIVKAAITYGDEAPKRAYQVKSRWGFFYGASLFIGCAGMFLNYTAGKPYLETLMTVMVLCAVFGAYFCFFVKMKLPSFYDENKLSFFYDVAFHMNMPGLKFNNRNWPHIVKTVRVCMCLSLIGFPVVNFALGAAMRNLGPAFGNYLFLFLFLGGFFIPVYVAGKKYE